MATVSQQIQQIYVGLLGRAADKAGLDYWAAEIAGGVLSIEQLRANIVNEQPEYAAGQGSMTRAQAVADLYENLFNRQPDDAGLEYWVNGGGASVNIDQLVLALIDGAAAADQLVLDNKTEVAEYYTAAAGADYTADAAAGAVDDVDGTRASVDAAKGAVDSGSVATGDTYMLTKGLDNYQGTSGNDTIIGSVDNVNGELNTMSTLDVVNGGAGVDTLQIAFNHALTPAIALPNLSNVEIIEVQATQAVTLDTSAVAGVTDIKLTKATGTAGLTGSDAQNITASGAVGKLTINGGKDIVVNDDTADVAMDIGQTTANKGTITVTDTKQGTGAIKIDGGTDVTVTLSGVTTGTLDIGQAAGTTADPSGAVVVKSTGAAFVAATDVTLGAIKVDGGKTISVTQVATSDASKAAADKTGGTITQSAVTIKAGTTTTDVTVKQDAAVGETLAADSTGGATTSDSIKFGALAATKTVVLGGLTLTATVDMTAAEVAAAFANLAAGAAKPGAANGDTQSAAAVTKATYTGSINGWTSGAANGDTVVFTSTTANGVVAAITDSGNGGATTITSVATGKAHDATPVGGVMGISNGVVDITGAAALKTVTVDGYAAGAGANKVQGATNTALDTITLANGGNMTISSAAATLALSATNVAGTVDVAAGTTTLNATVNGTGTAALKSASIKTVNVVAGSGTVSGVNTDLTAATAINTTGFTGTASFTIKGADTTYTGGAGVDNVTVADANVAIAKAIALGDGNDTLTLTGGDILVPTVTLDGGNGTDTLAVAAAQAATDKLSANTNFAGKITGFERLELTGSLAASKTVALDKLGLTDYVITNGVDASQKLTLDNLANNGTLVLKADTAAIDVNVKDAATGTADALNVVLSKDGVLAGGTLTAANVESLKITATDPGTTAIATHTLTLKADKATALTVDGNAGLNLTLDAATVKLASIDGSTMTGGVLTAAANGAVVMTIKGGAGNDVLSASSGANAKADVINGGDGNDTITAGSNGAKLTGGAGNDIFVLASAAAVTGGNKEANTYSTIEDFSAGDLLQLAYHDGAAKVVTSFAKLGAALDAGTAVFSDYVNAAMVQAAATTAGTAGDAVWFSFGGSSYVVVDSGTETTGVFTGNEDLIIKLAGVDLTNASWNADFGTVSL